MRHYTISVSPEAEADIERVYNYIAYEVMVPDVALCYYFGIYDTIRKLAYLGNVLAVSSRESLRLLYGDNVRTISYKKITIIYNIIGEIVYIRRVIASSIVR